MNEKTLQLLEKFTNQLGQNMHDWYPKLVHAIQIEAIIHLIYYLLLGIGLFFSWKYTISIFKKYFKHAYTDEDVAGTMLIGTFFLVVVLTVVFSIVTVTSIPDSISALIAPESFIFQTLTH